MLKGPDASIEISLKEYGIAWEIGETETKFYYGVNYDGTEFVLFDWADLENDLDVKIEYDWADLRTVSEFADMNLTDWENAPLIEKIQTLVNYYGVENVFGSSYTEDMTYKGVIANGKESV